MTTGGCVAPIRKAARLVNQKAFDQDEYKDSFFIFIVIVAPGTSWARCSPISITTTGYSQSAIRFPLAYYRDISNRDASELDSTLVFAMLTTSTELLAWAIFLSYILGILCLFALVSRSLSHKQGSSLVLSRLNDHRVLIFGSLTAVSLIHTQFCKLPLLF